MIMFLLKEWDFCQDGAFKKIAAYQKECRMLLYINKSNKVSKSDQSVDRKVQGVPQTEAIANPRHQVEEKKDKN